MYYIALLRSVVSDVSSVFLLDWHRDVLLNLKRLKLRNEPDWSYAQFTGTGVLTGHEKNDSKTS